jgi:hypothetical protein
MNEPGGESTTPNPTTEATDVAAQRTHFSRWRRFSPSMGWKAFWSEILIVVLGVAIALAASEAVENWNWRQKVADGEARLRADTDNVFEWSAERYATGPCIDAQLAALIDRVMLSGERLEPAPVQTSVGMRRVLTAPQRPFRFPIWDALVADGTASRLSPQRQALYGRIGESMARMRLRNEDYMRLRGRMLVLVHPIALDAVTRNGLLTDLEELRAMNAADVRSLGQDMDIINSEGLAPAESLVEEFLATSTTLQFCREEGLPMNDWRDTSAAMIGAGVSPSTQGPP